MKTFIKYLLLFAAFIILLSFGIFSFIKGEEQEKEIKYLESEVERLENELENCPK